MSVLIETTLKDYGGKAGHKIVWPPEPEPVGDRVEGLTTLVKKAADDMRAVFGRSESASVHVRVTFRPDTTMEVR